MTSDRAWPAAVGGGRRRARINFALMKLVNQCREELVRCRCGWRWQRLGALDGSAIFGERLAAVRRQPGAEKDVYRYRCRKGHLCPRSERGLLAEISLIITHHLRLSHFNGSSKRVSRLESRLQSVSDGESFSESHFQPDTNNNCVLVSFSVMLCGWRFD